ncbi:DoxX family protein [uncultured Kriegella sp.]|uniref:DoxX family protein n=1 Tax=uncultured Kriegella sp. TaxID=1798910 RepID=UPI0030DADEA5|tara:strand:+ start:36423 stop:36812 length:390 start_codon:yes stop_codon:yes gene_type:complete
MLLSSALVVSKIIIAITIGNVWLFRVNKPTPWRGGDAKSMKEEFETYGLSKPIMYLVGTIKIALAIVLVISIWVTDLSTPTAGAMGIFMLGAIAMHFKVADPKIRSFPALILLLLCIGIVVGEVLLEDF